MCWRWAGNNASGRYQRGNLFSVLSVPGNHHHLPVCRGGAAALYAVPAAGWASYSQTWRLHPATAQWGGLWGDHSNQYQVHSSTHTHTQSVGEISAVNREVPSKPWSRFVFRTLHTEHVFLVYQLNVKSLNMSLILCLFRRCVRRRTAPRPKGTQCWSGWRGHSNAGRSRSRNNARLFLTATRC